MVVTARLLLHAAAEGDNVQVITPLITAGADTDMNAKAPSTGHTPPHLAIVSGQEAAAKMLIMTGAGFIILDAEEDAPPHVAIEGGHVGIAQDLLISGADPSAKDSKRVYSLHLAARRGQDEVVLALVVLALVHKGANLHCCNSGGMTPLFVVVTEDHTPTVKSPLG